MLKTKHFISFIAGLKDSLNVKIRSESDLFKISIKEFPIMR